VESRGWRLLDPIRLSRWILATDRLGPERLATGAFSFRGSLCFDLFDNRCNSGSIHRRRQVIPAGEGLKRQHLWLNEVFQTNLFALDSSQVFAGPVMPDSLQRSP
jgi:hypothetical protein